MKMNVAAISEKGEKITLDSQQLWLAASVEEATLSLDPIAGSTHGTLSIHRHNELVSFSGDLSLDLNSHCDRCLEAFQFTHHFPIRMTLSPVPAAEEGDEPLNPEEELELTQDDMEFSFYEGQEIDLKEIIRELIVLSLPLQFICSEECKGLCPECGTNLNQGVCSCVSEKSVDPRWAVLKNLKLKN